MGPETLVAQVRQVALDIRERLETNPDAGPRQNVIHSSETLEDAVRELTIFIQ